MSLLHFPSFDPPPPPTDAEVFGAWVAFGGGWTLDEFDEAYRSVRR